MRELWLILIFLLCATVLCAGIPAHGAPCCPGGQCCSMPILQSNAPAYAPAVSWPNPGPGHDPHYGPGWNPIPWVLPYVIPPVQPAVQPVVYPTGTYYWTNGAWQWVPNGVPQPPPMVRSVAATTVVPMETAQYSEVAIGKFHPIRRVLQFWEKLRPVRRVLHFLFR